MPECSAIACRREGAGRPTLDELQLAEEGDLLCVRDCARAHVLVVVCIAKPRHGLAAEYRQHDKIKLKSAYKK